MNQDDLTLNYIKDFGKITTWDAYKDLGITRLSARIYNLKKRGYKFKTKQVHAFNRYGKLISFKEYYFEKKEPFWKKLLKK